MNWEPEHSQVDLPELGFTVDEGLEDLIRACWHRGIATFGCCIGDDDDPGYIGFTDGLAALRWENLTGLAVDWIDDEEIATVAEVYFYRSDVAGLVDKLRNTSPAPSTP